MGAAIADAMGGPVECQHYQRIAREYPDFQDLLPYKKPPGLIGLGPGYALNGAPGNVTDDTYIRLDLAKFLLANDPPYTARRLAPWLLEHADFSNWWKVAVRPLKRIESGETTAEKAGLNHKQGGGGGWWQPVAILYAGDPRGASAVTADLCRIWKAPLERDILSSVAAGQAAAFQANATIDSVVDAVLEDSGPLAKRLFTRAVEIARRAKTDNQLYEMLYRHCLVARCSKDVDGPMPPHVEPKDDADGFYSGILFAEQQPLALAYFVYGKGDAHKTVLKAVKGGRDADSIATNSASWLGAMAGESVWPKRWLRTVQQANIARVNLEQTAHDLIARALKNGTVRFDML
ncbi:MAG: ADP-ribosylglycohydrolase family protein [Planctomycetota bacterium]|jgi:ADP-ribosylglycohydrolase